MRHAEEIQQPKHDDNHDHRIENAFDRALHRDVGIYQSEKNSDDNQRDQYLNEHHGLPPLASGLGPARRRFPSGVTPNSQV